jgi:hypothetical protein
MPGPPGSVAVKDTSAVPVGLGESRLPPNPLAAGDALLDKSRSAQKT